MAAASNNGSGMAKIEIMKLASKAKRKLNNQWQWRHHERKPQRSGISIGRQMASKSEKRINEKYQ
jgi:hypothetical protein